MKKRSVLPALALVALVPVAQAGDEAAERGAALLAPFKSELKRALTEGMQKGPATTIEVCSKDAPAIAASLSVDGVRMGRSSHKLRNPANVAPDWLVPIIDAGGEAARSTSPLWNSTLVWVIVALALLGFIGMRMKLFSRKGRQDDLQAIQARLRTLADEKRSADKGRPE